MRIRNSGYLGKARISEIETRVEKKLRERGGERARVCVCVREREREREREGEGLRGIETE